MSPRSRTMLLAAALGHLVLVVTGGLDICLWETGALGRVLTYYSALTGADTGYGFFAPKVASPPTAAFTLVDVDGRAIVDSLPPGITREADIRVEDLLEVFDHRRSDDRIRARLAASWAATLFARHPQAASVTVDMGFRRTPSMAALRRGAAPRWRSVYRARVVRPARGGQGGAP
ncbi:hypothetical protein [Nannocystis pusilla]|uniref:Uncharacterized protein n=1 Tax=Nannocystis pusilla TaxID=889268 RepID=A0ABS7TLS3_9BACT|nr:hypothetical protein [Nannocystis pusilla]MBZ5709160.1 hypothetical protein [Nannocystis pusilla]